MVLECSLSVKNILDWYQTSMYYWGMSARMKDVKIPTIKECKRAGTHMLRCTGDGYCKVCFDREAADAESLFIAEVTSGN
jgi:hypothetical protein